MKSWLLSLTLCLILLLNLIPGGSAQAQELVDPVAPDAVQIEQTIPATPPTDDTMQHLSTKVLPQIANILTPEQCDQVETEIKNGKSFRKAFKALALTPDQKSQLAAVFKALPKKDMLASLTPEQKKQFFLKKKEGFIPTAEEINEKITAGMKMKTNFIPEAAAQSMKDKGKSIPTPEEIAKKISDGIKAKINPAATETAGES